MRVLPASALLALVALALGGCGDDAEPPIGPGTTTPTSSEATAATAAPDVAAPGDTATPPADTVADTAPPPPPLQGLALEVVAEGLDTPVFLTSPPGDERLFVVEKPGRIRLVGTEGGLFLDLGPLVGEGHLEQGLLGLAFHPAYADNGRFFVHYTDRGGTSTLAEYRVSDDDPNRADRESGEVLLTQDQPAGNHNGGMIGFGPDGYLYLALGDGGGADDRFGNGQRPDTLLGTILRLDVDGGEPYAIPPDNPFADGQGGAGEVWAYGLRNPWRFAIDAGLLYIGDVGQSDWEEIDVAPVAAAGLNYGWPITEGAECFRSPDCATGGLTPPVVVYGHDEGCSVTGGDVYRGAAIPELEGHYFYADWCGGWVRSFRYEDGVAAEGTDWSEDLGGSGQIVSFGRDAFGEIYVLSQDGFVYRVVPRR